MYIYFGINVPKILKETAASGKAQFNYKVMDLVTRCINVDN